MKTAILGIDPGLSGACALYDAGAVTVFDMPTTERVVNHKNKRQLNEHELAAYIAVHEPFIKLAILEQVGAMPGQGVTSSFNFGLTFGAIRGILAACGVPYQTVSPQVWKRKFGLLGQDKDASRAEASRRLPGFSNLWPLKKHDGRAEAALLAIYGSQLEVK